MSAHVSVIKVGSTVPIEIVAPAPLQVTVANLGPHSVYVGDGEVSALNHLAVIPPSGTYVVNGTTRWMLSCARSRLAVSTPNVRERLSDALRELAELKGEK